MAPKPERYGTEQLLGRLWRDRRKQRVASPLGGGGLGAAPGQGTTWYSGSGAPSSGTGVDGDFYLRTDTGQIYLKASGTWSSIIDLLTASEAGSYQPLDSDLTAIAALTTTSFGRSLLELANGAAGLTALGAQPLDSDLTAIAALSTTAYGRSLLETASASAARTLLGVAIGTDVQAYDADLAALAALSTTAFGRGFLELADAAAARTYIGLGSIATQAANNVNITGGSITGITDLAVADGGTGASTASGARTNLGLVIGTDVQAYDAATVKGPASATADDLAVYDGTTGKLLKDTSKKSANVPSDGEKSALAGTDGTPGSANRYVTDSDGRLNLTQLSLRNAILSLDPLLYWDLGANGATDLSGNGRNGTASGGVTIGGAGAITSDGNASTDFDGSDDKITSSYSPFATDSVRTFIGWMHRDSVASLDTFFGGSTAGGPYAQLQIDGSVLPGRSSVILNADADTAGNIEIVTPAFGTTTVMVVVTLDMTGAAFTGSAMVNGVDYSGLSQSPRDYDASPGNFQLGARGSGTTDPFDGKMAHVAIFNGTLTPATVEWLFRIGAGHTKEWGLVTSLPSGALVGDRCTYVADATNGILWELVYDGQGSYPWKFIGGRPLVASVETQEARATASYGALATAGPSITNPLAGDYDLEIEAEAVSGGGTVYGIMSFDRGGTGAVDADGYWGGNLASNYSNQHSERRLTGLAAGTAFTAKYKPATAVSYNWAKRRMRMWPVRVG